MYTKIYDKINLLWNEKMTHVYDMDLLFDKKKKKSK